MTTKKNEHKTTRSVKAKQHEQEHFKKDIMKDIMKMVMLVFLSPLFSRASERGHGVNLQNVRIREDSIDFQVTDANGTSEVRASSTGLPGQSQEIQFEPWHSLSQNRKFIFHAKVHTHMNPRSIVLTFIIAHRNSTLVAG